jgi:hypothetical protein
MQTRGDEHEYPQGPPGPVPLPRCTDWQVERSSDGSNPGRQAVHDVLPSPETCWPSQVMQDVDADCDENRPTAQRVQLAVFDPENRPAGHGLHMGMGGEQQMKSAPVPATRLHALELHNNLLNQQNDQSVYTLPSRRQATDLQTDPPPEALACPALQRQQLAAHVLEHEPPPAQQHLVEVSQDPAGQDAETTAARTHQCSTDVNCTKTVREDSQNPETEPYGVW